MAEHREQGLDASIAALWEQARERALRRVDVVEEAVAALLGGPLEGDLAEAARREAHKLAGSLGTFGMPAVAGTTGSSRCCAATATCCSTRATAPSGSCSRRTTRSSSCSPRSSSAAGPAHVPVPAGRLEHTVTTLTFPRAGNTFRHDNLRNERWITATAGRELVTDTTTGKVREDCSYTLKIARCWAAPINRTEPRAGILHLIPGNAACCSRGSTSARASSRPSADPCG